MEIENSNEERVWAETIGIVRTHFENIGYRVNLSDYFLLLQIFRQIYKEVENLKVKLSEGQSDLYENSAPQWWHGEVISRFLHIRFGICVNGKYLECFSELGHILNYYREREEML